MRCGQPRKNGSDGTGLAGSRSVKVAAVTAALMVDAFGITGPATEENDG